VVEFRIHFRLHQSARVIHHDVEEAVVSRRTRGDDGVAIVEAAIIMPLLMLVLFGFMEYSNLFKDKMSVSNAAHDSAREASQSANFYDADFSVLVIAGRSLRSLSADVNKVIVFKASSTSDAVPPACLAITPVAGQPNGVAGVCNVYVGSYVTSLASSERTNFGFVSPSPDKYDKMYPALTRSASRTVTEYVGVYIEAHYEHITGAVPTPTTIRAVAVTPIEARTA
jgi:Flp pilus assembly protein TadG